MNVGKRIVCLRESMGISTNRLANMAGISQSYLRDVELGNKNLTVEVLSYICYALNVSLKEFFNENSKGIHPSLATAIDSLSESEQIKLAGFIAEIKRLN